MLKVQYDSGKVVITHYWNVCMFSYKFWVFLPILASGTLQKGKQVKTGEWTKAPKKNDEGKTSQSKVVLCDELATIHKLLSPTLFFPSLSLLPRLCDDIHRKHWVQNKRPRPKSEQTRPYTKTIFTNKTLVVSIILSDHTDMAHILPRTKLNFSSARASLQNESITYRALIRVCDGGVVTRDENNTHTMPS